LRYNWQLKIVMIFFFCGTRRWAQGLTVEPHPNPLDWMLFLR
jgi:hypothetical protein